MDEGKSDKEKSREERFAEIRKGLTESLDKARSRRVTLDPPPRYDDVFFNGLNEIMEADKGPMYDRLEEIMNQHDGLILIDIKASSSFPEDFYSFPKKEPMILAYPDPDPDPVLPPKLPEEGLIGAALIKAICEIKF